MRRRPKPLNITLLTGCRREAEHTNEHRSFQCRWAGRGLLAGSKLGEPRKGDPGVNPADLEWDAATKKRARRTTHHSLPAGMGLRGCYTFN